MVTLIEVSLDLQVGDCATGQQPLPVKKKPVQKAKQEKAELFYLRRRKQRNKGFDFRMATWNIRSLLEVQREARGKKMQRETKKYVVDRCGRGFEGLRNSNM